VPSSPGTISGATPKPRNKNDTAEVSKPINASTLRNSLLSALLRCRFRLTITNTQNSTSIKTVDLILINLDNSIIPQTPPAQHKNRHQKPHIPPTPQQPETPTSPTSTNKTARGFPRPSPPSHYLVSSKSKTRSPAATPQTPA